MDIYNGNKYIFETYCYSQIRNKLFCLASDLDKLDGKTSLTYICVLLTTLYLIYMLGSTFILQFYQHYILAYKILIYPSTTSIYNIYMYDDRSI